MRRKVGHDMTQMLDGRWHMEIMKITQFILVIFRWNFAAVNSISSFHSDVWTNLWNYQLWLELLSVQFVETINKKISIFHLERQKSPYENFMLQME